LDQIKINMKEPFKLEKKVRREIDVIQSKEQNSSVGIGPKKDEVPVLKKAAKEKKTSKKTSKKAIKEAAAEQDAE